MREKFKSIVLFILFIMALVLTYLNTLQPFFVVSRSPEIEVSRDYIISVVKPRAMFYSNGGGEYTRIYRQESYDKIWNKLFVLLSQVLDGAEVLEEVTKREYISFFETRSFLILLPGTDRNFMTNSGVLGSFYCYDEAVVAEGGVYVRQKDRHYRVKGADFRSNSDRSEHSGGGDLDEVFSYVRENAKYRRVMDRFSLKDTLGDRDEFLNYYPIPYDYLLKMIRLSVKKEFEIKDRSAINLVAKAVIGDRLDFTQIFEDSEKSIVFVYNKGEKSLTFREDGSMHYKARISGGSRMMKDDFESALKSAVGLISVSGGIPESLNLKRCYRNENQQFVFDFVYRIDAQYPVFGTSDGIRVVVEGDVVVEMIRNIVVPDFAIADDFGKTITIDRCIYKNLDIFTDFPETEKLYRICSGIDEVHMGLYHRGNELTPTWEIVVDGIRYLFDAVTGEYIREAR